MGTRGGGSGGTSISGGVEREAMADATFTAREVQGHITGIERGPERLRAAVKRGTGREALSAKNIQRALESRRGLDAAGGIQGEIAGAVEALGRWTVGVVPQRAPKGGPSRSRGIAQDMERRIPRSVMDRGFERRNMAEGAVKIAEGVRIAKRALAGLKKALPRKKV